MCHNSTSTIYMFILMAGSFRDYADTEQNMVDSLHSTINGSEITKNKLINI